MAKQPANSESKPLSVRHERFCEAVVSGMSATQAYIAAGYQVSEKVAGTCGPRLMENAGVKRRIAELRAPQTAAALLTKDEKRRYLAKLVRTPIGQLTPDSDLCTEYVTTQVAGGRRGKLRRGNAPEGNETSEEPVVQVRVKMADKLRAIELDSKLAGHFEPDQLVVETGPKTLEMLEQRAKAVESRLVRRIAPPPSGERLSPKEAVAASGRN